ncbi:MAG: substrate-binding domain-containing protein [Bacillota bacterium]|nr:substrate-binding domain-containing protein [Bacillota bacterium]
MNRRQAAHGRRPAVLALALTAILTLSACGAPGAGRTSAAGGAAGTKENAQSGPPKPANPRVILATTTSTQDSGLLDVLQPMFEKKTGYRLSIVAVGTGQALAMGERGEADVLLVHAPEAEMAAVSKGVAVDRRLVMHNDFVLVGPPDDPAGVKGTATAAEAFRKIARAQALFISRGDESGTHVREKSIWKKAGIQPEGKWYQQSGSGMGQTLGIASEKGAYTLTDRATYLALKQHLRLGIVLEGDASLLNIYHVMQVNPARFAKVNAEGAKAFVDFMTAPETQKVIGRFGVEEFGQPLFFPDAGKSEKAVGGSS